jgi:hypothetical protein
VSQGNPEAREVEKGAISGEQILMTDQQSSELAKPGVGSFDDPTSLGVIRITFWNCSGAARAALPAAGPGFRGVRGRVVDCAYGYQEEDQEEASKNEETCRQKGQANEEEG